jgi:hypothetical protein
MTAEALFAAVIIIGSLGSLIVFLLMMFSLEPKE